ncbi:hypothetical protein Taro_026625 [Colocasia esculenta]|uniref:Uncharacterized protein n=1 Tax=Colocasia esculenta TaxID=4460 RepID=A0A843VFR1_COLES|nr:hypothetical protein [Colocasia esculenta]
MKTLPPTMIESSSCGDDYDGVIYSQLNLIDLVRSESSKTETTGLRRKEGSYINKYWVEKEGGEREREKESNVANERREGGTHVYMQLQRLHLIFLDNVHLDLALLLAAGMVIAAAVPLCHSCTPGDADNF